MKTLKFLRTGIVASSLSLAAVAHSQTVYTQNFDADDTANWTVNGGPPTTDWSANFFFDYSTVGIPSAPNSGGTTRGLRLQANQSSGVFGGLSVSPTGQSFLGDYTLSFDMWLSFNGPAPDGGSGSTQIGGGGIGTSGTVAQWPGGSQDSIWFAATADGQSSSDWRAYSPTAPTRYADTSGVYAAGNHAGSSNGSDPYYAGFGNVAAPGAQLALYPQQSGNTLAGAAGWAWHEVNITKSGGTVTWTVDGLLIATVNASDDTVNTGNNILLLYSDTNATSSTDPNDVNLLFGLFDNVRVTLVPEPSALALVGLGGFAMLLRRRK
ncbi:MAG TPA: PEP-CTERM sorting domain-containing protein [Verrucomicrobiae bacterium]|nr:PEP-CTERM sorting domain-containing protein [Verrucomicrobiae bacterium]